MSFTVVAQYNASEDNRLTKALTQIGSYDGYLRDQSSIIDPVILINADITTLASANYLTISSFGRSYFIKDMISVRAGLTQVTAHVDVLTSFATGIRSNKGIVYKQTNDWNLYLDDGSIKIYSNPRIVTKSFPSGFSGASYLFAVSG